MVLALLEKVWVFKSLALFEKAWVFKVFFLVQWAQRERKTRKRKALEEIKLIFFL